MSETPLVYTDVNNNGLLDLDIFFDFLCPYSFQVATWITQVNDLMGPDVMSVHWRFFSLEQSHRPDENWNIWEQTPETSRGLLAFLAGSAALDSAGEAGLAKFYMALAKSHHIDGATISDPSVISSAWEVAGLDPQVLAAVIAGTDRGGLKKIQTDHTEAIERWGAFGSPTLVFEESKAFFLKLMPAPTEVDQSLELFQHVQRLAMGFDNGVHEFKRTNLG